MRVVNKLLTSFLIISYIHTDPRGMQT